jgi:hypothetical protein
MWLAPTKRRVDAGGHGVTGEGVVFFLTLFIRKPSAEYGCVSLATEPLPLSFVARHEAEFWDLELSRSPSAVMFAMGHRWAFQFLRQQLPGSLIGALLGSLKAFKVYLVT